MTGSNQQRRRGFTASLFFLAFMGLVVLQLAPDLSAFASLP
jgi:hypothetical protein